MAGDTRPPMPELKSVIKWLSTLSPIAEQARADIDKPNIPYSVILERVRRAALHILAATAAGEPGGLQSFDDHQQLLRIVDTWPKPVRGYGRKYKETLATSESVRLTESQRAAIRAAARGANQKPGAWMRDACLQRLEREQRGPGQ